MSDPVLTVRCARRQFVADRAALNGADLDLRCGRVTALLGPSGSGKTTLLRAIAGLERLDGGEIRSGETLWSGPGVHLAPERRRVGLVFQDFALFPHLTALDNVAFGLRGPRAERRARAMARLDAAELGHRANAWPHEMSGGEQQRVALARALAPEPDIVLMDEPFSGLDRRLRAALREQSVAALKAAGTAALIVTHDAEEAMAAADELALMAEGRVIQTGAPEDVYLNPVSAIAARLLGDVETWIGITGNGRLGTPLGTLPAPHLPAGRQAMALIRPEAIMLSHEPGGAPVRIRSRRLNGARTSLVIETVDGSRWRALAPLTQRFEPGDGAHASLDPAFARVVAGGGD